MAWAKLHTDILGDPKLMRAARKGMKGLDLLPWIIAFAKEANDGGYLSVGGEPAEPEDIAELVPGVTPKRVRECLESLVAIGVLERIQEDSATKCGIFLAFPKWEHRSGTKPSDSKERIHERVKAHRERKALQDNEAVTPRNALHPERSNATEQKREEAEQKRVEKKPARAPRAPRDMGWFVPFADIWRARFGGELTPSKSVRPLVGLHARDPAVQPEVLRRWGIYVAQASSGQYASAAKFAETYGEWEHPPPPKQNGNGFHRVGGVTNRSFENAMRAMGDEP